MCDYCANGEIIGDEYAAYSAKIVKITPLPAIDLSTGEVDTTADPPYYSFFVSDDFDKGEIGSFPIKYCPMCGRDLSKEAQHA